MLFKIPFFELKSSLKYGLFKSKNLFLAVENVLFQHN